MRVGGALAAAAFCILSACAPDDGVTKLCEGGSGVKPDDAIAACTKLIETAGQTPVALSTAFNNRGRAYGNKGQHDKAIAEFDEAVSRNPENVNAVHNRGIAYARTEKYERALADFERVVQLAPDFAIGFYNLGRAKAELGRFAEAIGDFDRAVRLNPSFVDAFRDRGSTYRELGKYDDAIFDYDHALSLKPDDFMTLSNRGNAFNMRGDYDKAIADLDRAIELKPKYAPALNNRCWVRAVAGKALESALTDCTEALKYRRNHPGILDSRSVVYFRLGRFAEAIADTDIILKALPEKANALYVRGAARLRSGDKGGQADIDAAKAINAKTVDEYAGYGVVP